LPDAASRSLIAVDRPAARVLAVWAVGQAIHPLVLVARFKERGPPPSAGAPDRARQHQPTGRSPCPATPASWHRLRVLSSTWPPSATISGRPALRGSRRAPPAFRPPGGPSNRQPTRGDRPPSRRWLFFYEGPLRFCRRHPVAAGTPAARVSAYRAASARLYTPPAVVRDRPGPPTGPGPRRGLPLDAGRRRPVRPKHWRQPAAADRRPRRGAPFAFPLFIQSALGIFPPAMLRALFLLPDTRTPWRCTFRTVGLFRPRWQPAAPAFAGRPRLPSWNDGPAKKAILEFVRGHHPTRASPRFCATRGALSPPSTQDGTLWVEHPMYTQVVYCLERVPDGLWP